MDEEELALVLFDPGRAGMQECLVGWLQHETSSFRNSGSLLVSISTGYRNRKALRDLSAKSKAGLNLSGMNNRGQRFTALNPVLPYRFSRQQEQKPVRGQPATCHQSCGSRRSNAAIDQSFDHSLLFHLSC